MIQMKALRAFNLGLKRINAGEIFSIEESRVALFESYPQIAIRIVPEEFPNPPPL